MTSSNSFFTHLFGPLPKRNMFQYTSVWSCADYEQISKAMDIFQHLLQILYQLRYQKINFCLIHIFNNPTNIDIQKTFTRNFSWSTLIFYMSMTSLVLKIHYDNLFFPLGSCCCNCIALPDHSWVAGYNDYMCRYLRLQYILHVFNKWSVGRVPVPVHSEPQKTR